MRSQSGGEPVQPSLKLPAVDVLRGVAALGVAWFHSRVDLWVGFRAIQANPTAYTAVDRALSYLSLPASQMGGLVMLFFVLSGFCIHLPVAAKNLNPHWGSYMVRRGLRIYPAYIVTLAFSFLVSLLVLKRSGDGLSEINTFASSSLMLQNWVSGGQQISLNPSLWSIPIEVEFYLLYPLLLFLWRRMGLGAAMIVTLLCTGIGGIIFLLGYSQANVTFFKFAVIWNSGAWLAEAYAKGRLPKWTRWHLFALVAAFVGTIASSFAGLNDYYLNYGWALASFMLLMWVLGPGARVFTTRHWWVSPLVFVGMVSYSFYLLHFPLFKLAGAMWVQLYGSKPESFLLPTLATVMVVPFAWIFYRLVELPTHEIGRRWGAVIQKRKSFSALNSGD